MFEHLQCGLSLGESTAS